MLLPVSSQGAPGMREGFTGMDTTVFYKFESSKFPGDAFLNEEGDRTLCNAIFNRTVSHVDEKDWNKGVALCTSRK